MSLYRCDEHVLKQGFVQDGLFFARMEFIADGQSILEATMPTPWVKVVEGIPTVTAFNELIPLLKNGDDWTDISYYVSTMRWKNEYFGT